MKNFKCMFLSVCVLVCMLASSQVKGQTKTKESTGIVVETGLKKETKERYYFIDKDGKKKYVSTSKTQVMWTEILAKCPSCIDVAEEYNVNIYQNKKYQKKSDIKNL